MPLFIISGPSQGGKTTLANLLLKDKNIVRVITATSRKPRLDEIDKIDYYFLKEEYFENKSKFIEMAIVHGNYYGTLKSEIELKLKSGKNVIWIMDVQGVKFILENYKELPKDTITIFLTPDKLSILLKRINLKNDPNLKERIESIKKEFSYLSFFKYTVNTSKTVDESLKCIKDIIKGNIKEDFTKQFNFNEFFTIKL